MESDGGSGEDGTTRSIGVSNFNKTQLGQLLSKCTIKPSVNQIESNPYLLENDMVEYCREHGIAVTAYSPLGSSDRPWAEKDEPKLLEDPTVMAIARKHNKSSAQVCIRFQVQRGVIVIPKSVTPTRIEENLKVFDFELTPEDVKALSSTGKSFRSCVPVRRLVIGNTTLRVPRDIKHPEFPFGDLKKKFAHTFSQMKDDRFD
eukprot:CAMPEP_0167782360 /NCGR_PEP_ID=MMETSP0111_2-20121227/6474_1 /TAXON_ID=91324 /ORGANISM="Lotharella globosa, Strain CCCM811" /LENGTH=202 /DNA_ID=CAMNT_0007673183 /DNA_START=111 /DNA_END=719 /DNA_ORIENTATION=+